ncbi:ABC transporter ATP-binding protein [Sulfuriroseicoccus oceanibius]|uniref:ABC transporter ATP-binding protein n=1 Tax=Sulfuriroseicoccus oceanibius TaxID=2707525 RepID=A0A6B3LF23_9BACT|nr:ABC transporter ATP-binding protein [Sulfuriroseicoccus oceanibius]QQL45756.1 ABC transporter ATP-binding protein [Sulfuriroseicoccus oceanibius]
MDLTEAESASDGSAVRIRGLAKDFKIPLRRKLFRAVDDVSLDVEEGEVYGLIGPNGSGKSTTMKVMLGIMSPTEGECRIFGRPAGRADSRREVGYLPENPYFYKHLTGAETMRFYGGLCGLKGKALRQRADELLDMVGLSDAADRRIGGYSKGMLQRIGLAQAVIHNPRLVVLDEPTAGVDPMGSRQIRDLILDLKKRGITVFLTSHLLEQVQEVCDRVGIIFRGRMLRQGRLDEMVAVEDQTEVVLSHPSPALLDRIQALVADDEAASVVRMGHPRTSLERLFIEATSEQAALEDETK